MTSVITSARQSTASVFDTLGSMATSVNSLVNVGTTAIEALDLKTKAMLQSTIVDSKIRALLVEDATVMEATLEHVDLLEQFHKRSGSTDAFDRAKAIRDTQTRLQVQALGRTPTEEPQPTK